MGWGSSQAELGSLLPCGSLPPPPGLSLAAGSSPAAALEAVPGVLGLKSPPSSRAFWQREQAPRHLPLGRRQAWAFRALQRARSPQEPSWCPRRHPPGQEVSKAIYLPSARSSEGPASPPRPCAAPLPLLSLVPLSGRKQWRCRCSNLSVDPPRHQRWDPLSSPAHPWGCIQPWQGCGCSPRAGSQSLPCFLFLWCVSPQITARDGTGANCWPGPSPAGASSAPQAPPEELGAAAQGAAGDLGPPSVPCRAGTVWGWGPLALVALFGPGGRASGL